MAKTMLIASDLPRKFWADAVNTACYILNRVLIRPILLKTPYELFKGVKLIFPIFEYLDVGALFMLMEKET